MRHTERRFTPLLTRSHILSAISSVYFDPEPFGAPIFFLWASAGFLVAGEPLPLPDALRRAVGPSGAFWAVSGIAVFLVRRLSVFMITDFRHRYTKGGSYHPLPLIP